MRRRDDRARRPRRARRARPAPRAGRGRRHDARTAQLSRDLYHRAIEVMAGAQALGEFVSLDAAESFADRVLAARALQARAGAAAGRAAGQGRARHRRARAASAARSSTRSPARARASSRSTSTATARPTRSRTYGDARRSPSRGDVTSEDAVAAAFAAAVDALRRRRHRRLQRRHRLERGDRGDDARRVEPQPRDPRHRLLPRRARGVRACCAQQGGGGSIVFVASKNALVAGKNAAAYSSAKAAELHLARCLAEEGGARRHPRQHGQPRRGPAGLADLGLVAGARSAPPPTASSPTSSRSTTASARRSA